MKEKKNGWIEDVEELVERSTVEEATAKVFEKFTRALERLDPESAELLRLHFDGVTAAELARRWGLKTEEIESWLSHKRKELVRNLKNEISVRQ